MDSMEALNVRIMVHSVMDGAGIDREYQGEYAIKNDTHMIVYTDYTGNAITKSAIQANETGMLLHRTGAFSGDMFFTLANPTFVNYSADGLAAKLVIHTQRYEIVREARSLTINLAYGLSDPDERSWTNAEQRIAILFDKNEENGSK